MLPKYVKKLLQELTLSPHNTNRLQTSLAKIDQASNLNLVNYTAGVCKILLKISENLASEEQQQIEIILFILKQLFQRIRNEDIYEIQLIKIKMFMVNLNYYNALTGQRNEDIIRKIHLFVQRIEDNVFYPLLQEDFYSQIQNIYLEAAKCLIKQASIQEAEVNIKKCYTSLKKQAVFLAELGKSQNDKYLRLLENKGRTLEQLFFLQYGNKAYNGDIVESELGSNIINRYESLFNRMGMKLNSQCLISQINKTLGRNHSEIHVDSEQENIEVKRKNTLTINRSQSIRSSYVSMMRQSKVETEIEQLARFIQAIQTKRVASCQSSKRPPGRLSLKIPQTGYDMRSTVRHSTVECLKVQRTTNPKFIIKQLSENGKSQHSKRDCIIKNDATHISQKGKSNKSSGKTVKKFDIVLRKEKENRQKLVLMNPFKDKKIKKADLSLKSSQTDMIMHGFITQGTIF